MSLTSSPLTVQDDSTKSDDTSDNATDWGHFMDFIVEEDSSADVATLTTKAVNKQRRKRSIFQQIQRNQKTMSPKAMGWTSVPL